jgi:hypothetical protein
MGRAVNSVVLYATYCPPERQTENKSQINQGVGRKGIKQTSSEQKVTTP